MYWYDDVTHDDPLSADLTDSGHRRRQTDVLHDSVERLTRTRSQRRSSCMRLTVACFLNVWRAFINVVVCTAAVQIMVGVSPLAQLPSTPLPTPVLFRVFLDSQMISTDSMEMVRGHAYVMSNILLFSSLPCSPLCLTLSFSPCSSRSRARSVPTLLAQALNTLGICFITELDEVRRSRQAYRCISAHTTTRHQQLTLSRRACRELPAVPHCVLLHCATCRLCWSCLCQSTSWSVAFRLMLLLLLLLFFLLPCIS